jgi:hypothetical protein
MSNYLLLLILAVVLLIAYRQRRGATISSPKNEVEIKFMINIADNEPDGQISVSLGGTYKDEEGSVVPVSLVDPVSTNPDAFSFEDITNKGTSLSATRHTGAPGFSTITFQAKRDDTGEVVQQRSIDVNVHAGAIVDAPPLNVDLGGLQDV